MTTDARHPTSDNRNYRWGHLERLRVRREAVLAEGPGGKRYPTGEEGPELWDLRCDCGNEFTKVASEINRRELRSCGRTDCIFSIILEPLSLALQNPSQTPTRSAGRPPLGTFSRAITVYMPMNLYAEIQRLAKEDPVRFRSFSHAAVKFMTDGIRAYKREISEQAKRNDERKEEPES